MPNPLSASGSGLEKGWSLKGLGREAPAYQIEALSEALDEGVLLEIDWIFFAISISQKVRCFRVSTILPDLCFWSVSLSGFIWEIIFGSLVTGREHVVMHNLIQVPTVINTPFAFIITFFRTFILNVRVVIHRGQY